MLEKINSYLYFAFASRHIVLGESALMKMRSKKVFLLVFAEDMGISSRKKAVDKATFYQIPYLFYKTKSELGTLVRKSAVSILGITDEKLAQAILKCKKEDGIYAKKETE